MTYIWKIEISDERIGIQKHQVTACKAHTAVSKCIASNSQIGTIRYERGLCIKRIKCEICGKTYEDNQESKKHHFEDYYFHKEAVKKLAEKEIKP